MSFVLGLTGSIGMGKSTTSAMFRDLGVPVWDADAAVHRLYAPGGSAVDAVSKLCPQALAPDGGIDRNKLRACIAEAPEMLDKITAIVHPLVAQDRSAFLAAATAPLVVLDIPLLYEGGGAEDCDAVAVVSAPAELQRQRVLARGMSEEEFEMILSRQMPDAEKRQRADFVIESKALEPARRQLIALVQQLTAARDA